MLSAIKRHPKAFSCAARMIQFHDRDRLDDAGNYYCALGWLMQEVRGKISIPMKRKRRFLLPVQELLFTERRSLMSWDILTKNILHIWRTWTWDTGPGSTDMKTGMHLMPWYTMWEAVTSGSRYNQFKIRYLPEIIFI